MKKIKMIETLLNEGPSIVRLNLSKPQHPASIKNFRI